MKKIILASGSPRRKEILSNVGAEFDIIVSNLDERKYIRDKSVLSGELSPEEQTMLLAEGKAWDVFDGLENQADFVIIGVDTSVVVDTEILGKPKDADDAVSMLMKLSGRKHQVISAFAIISSEKTVVDREITEVYMKPFSEADAKKYVSSEYVLDKAGAYAIQGRASLFIEKINGCYFNVVGLPIFKLSEKLTGFGIYLL